MERLRTGIEGFDAMVQGGLPMGSSVVLQGPPGQEKLLFALTFLADGLKAGGSGLVAISSESADAAFAQLRALGVDVDGAVKEKRLRVVDWYSWSEEPVQDTEERGPVVRSSIDLTNLGVALSRAIAGLTGEQPGRAVIELLSPATNVYEVTQVYAFAQTTKRKLDRHRFTSLVLIEKEMHSASELTTLHQPFDGVIEIERSRTGDRIVRKIGVLHLKDTAPDPTFRVLEMSEAGMRVVHDTPKPVASAPAARGGVLESQEERAQRLRLILQIATERLKLNPGDADALFAMAAAQATLDDAKGGVQTLERLADLDPRYPGLWVLKTKLHARLGQADMARQSRLRAEVIEPEAAKTITATVPCPMCETPVAIDSTMCASCGVKFAPTRTLEDELEDLSHVAVQEMVEEEFGVKARGKVRADVAPAKAEPKPSTEPTPKPAPGLRSKQSFTNGLLLGRIVRRRQGATNGLRGRANARRGRTNGLTNGLGRTNGLTNGLGRTNGLTNELGRTNGLTNGLGRTNGLTNGLGRTNGVTNGLGRTNGLTNGLRGVRTPGFRHLGSRGILHAAGWKLYVIPLVVAGLFLWPLFSVPEHGPAYSIRIDGQFGDWASVATEAMARDSGLNPNIDVVRFGVVDNLGPFAFYVEVAGTALQGGGPSPGTMDSVRIFVDIDGSATTGYRVDGLGADRMLDISGYGGAVLSATLWEFDSNRDSRDWNGWIKGTSTAAAAGGPRIEAEAEWLAYTSGPVIATVHTTSWDRQTDAGDFPVSPTAGTLFVAEDSLVPDILAGSGLPLLQLTLTAHGQPVSLGSIHVQIVGTAEPTDALALRLMDGGTALALQGPTARDITFSFPAIQIGVGETKVLTVVGDFTAITGETFGLRLPFLHPFGIGAGVVGLGETPGTRTVGYLGIVPSGPRVDGGFDEWTALSADGTGDVSPRPNPSIDLSRYGAQRGGASTYFYTDVTGRILGGTSAPEQPRPTPPASQPPADTDRDTVPDISDPMPLDFNNDGTPDAQTNGDYDGDGITDYGFPGGTDDWLNTTIPNTFPVPYAGRAVSVYVGPTKSPPAPGEDVLRLFLDVDNSTWSGYSIGGIGADRLIEIRGKEGEVTQSALLTFSGSFPGQWAWTPISPVRISLGYHAAEMLVPLAATAMYVEAGDFWGSVDSTTSVPAFASLASSFKAAPATESLSVPWETTGPQTAGTQIDPGSNSATTVYNQQRKVVRAGDVPGDGPCDANNSDGCWYAPFQAQFAEQTSTLPPKGPNVQENVATLAAGSSSVNVAITSVNTSKAFLVFNIRHNLNEPSNGTVAGTITSSTNVRFNRTGTGGVVDIIWYVAEFPSGVSVQRGAKKLSGSGGNDQNVPIRTVDLAKAFPIISYTELGAAYNCDDFIRATITTATNLRLSACQPDSWVEWQVVEYTASSVQTNSVVLMPSDGSKTYNLGVSVNTGKSWLLFTYNSTSGTDANIGQKMVRGNLTDSTTLTFNRDQTGTRVDIQWYLVSFTDDTTTRRASASFGTADLQKDAPLNPAVTLSRAIAFTGSTDPYSGGKTPFSNDDNPGVASATLNLTSTTNLRLNRATTGSPSQTADIGWFVIEFGTVITGSRIAGTFPTDILSEDGVFVQYREAVPYAGAAIAYRSNTGTNTVSSPKTRLWGGSSWGTEGEETTAARPIRAVRMAWLPTVPSTRIFVTDSDDGWLDAYVCSATCTVTNNIGRVWSTAPGTPERRFDVAYENVSGDAVLAYGVLSTDPAQDIAFRIFSLGSWGPEQYLDDTGHATDVQYTQIDLAPKKGSDIIGMIGGDDTNDDANAWIWDGDAWGSYTEITPTMESPNYRQVALAWESSSGNLLAVAALATSNDIISKEYSTSWSGTSQFTCASGGGMTKHTFWLSLKANPLATANDVVLGLVQENYDLNTCYWTGSAWANWVQHDTDYDAVQTRAFDFAWENSGSKGLLVWGTSRTTGGGQITYKSFTAPNTWGAQTNAVMGSGFDQWVQLRTNPFSGTVKILGAVLDSNRLLGAVKWDGSTFTVIGASSFSADTGIAAYESFDLRYRATIDGRLSVKYDFASVPAGDAYTLKIKGYRGDENVNVEVLTPPSSWNTRITIASTTNSLYTYDLTAPEYNSGSPSIRFVDALGSDAIASDVFVDLSVVVSKSFWDRVILMRSLDTSGSIWGSQVILASGRTGDNPVLYSYDSAEPSIAIDASGYLHVVWVSAASSGNQQTLNLVRYVKTIVAYPTQSQIASSANWQNVTPVDDADPGYMPTVSTDTSNNPHIAWSQLKSITASEAAAIEYRSNTGTNTVNSPKSRTWDGTSWSAPEIEEATTGSPLRNVRMAYSPIAIDERIVVTVSDDGWLDAYVCTPTCTVTNNLGQVWSSAPASTDYRFDIAYEELSGRALLVYGVLSTDTTHDIAYREYTRSWGPEQYLDNTNNATDLQYSVMELAPKAGSDQVGLMAGTTNGVDTAWIWSGTAFGSFAEVTATGFASTLGHRMAIAWETNSGHLLAVAAAGPLGETIVYREFTTSWSSSSTYPCGTSGKSDYWLSLKPNPVSTTDEMILLIGQTSSPVSTCYWSGSGWSNFVTHDATSDSWTTRVEDFAWESTGSRGLLVWGTTGGQITYRTFTAPNSWAGRWRATV